MQKKIKRMNKGVFLGAFLSPIAMGIIALILSDVVSGNHELENFLEVIVPFFLLVYGVVLFVCYVLFHYRMWAAIYDEQVDTPPKLAVLFLFVPLYNLYWIFKFYPGFVQYYNENIDRYGIGSEVQPIDKLVYTAYPLTQYISIIVGIVTALILLRLSNGTMILVCYVLFLIMVSKTCDAVNDLADALEEISCSDTSAGHSVEATREVLDCNKGIKLLLDEVRGKEDNND